MFVLSFIKSYLISPLNGRRSARGVLESRLGRYSKALPLFERATHLSFTLPRELAGLCGQVNHLSRLVE